MAVFPGSRARVRKVAWCFAALGVASGTTLACINFDGLDSTDGDGGILGPDSGGGGGQDTSTTPGCEAGIQTDPFNCGACGKICPLRVNSIPACTSGVCGLACNSNFGNCDNADDNGCETQLFADPKNCGACGRDCAGGGCTNGLCQPVTLASNQSYPQALAVDLSTVYWATLYNFQVDKIAKDGGTSSILASNEIYPSGVAIDTTNLYWVDRGYGSADGLVRKMPLAGGPPVSIVSGLSSRPTAITVAGTEIYYATLGTQGTDGSVVRVSISNDPDAGAGTVVGAAQNNPTSLAADTTGVYWTNYGSYVAPDAGPQNGAVMRCAVPGCQGGPEEVAGAQMHPRGIAVDANNVYWTNYGSGQSGVSDGSVMKAPKGAASAGDGGANGATMLASGLLYPDGITVDATYVYFTTRAGLVQRVPLAGGKAPETIATIVQSYPIALTADDKFLYFATPSGPAGGSIQKLLK